MEDLGGVDSYPIEVPMDIRSLIVVIKCCINFCPFSREDTFILLIGAQHSSNRAREATDEPLRARIVGRSNKMYIHNIGDTTSRHASPR